MAAKLAGKSTVAIAQAEGMSRDWIRQELESDESRQIVLGLVRRKSIELERLFTKSLVAIDAALDANKAGMFEGCQIDLGADHFARLAAAKRLLEVISLGRPPAKAKDTQKDSTSGSITFEDLVRMEQERQREKIH